LSTKQEQVGRRPATSRCACCTPSSPPICARGTPPSPPERFDLPDERDELIALRPEARSSAPPPPPSCARPRSATSPGCASTPLLIQFGHGKYQKRIQATITSETPHIAVEIASDKEETNRILGDLGLPVPRQKMVYTADRPCRPRRIGYPVVVKPLDANHGRGVSIDLQTPEEVTAAFEKAAEHARTVLVESSSRASTIACWSSTAS
jgi:cyanophycin synthetase